MFDCSVCALLLQQYTENQILMQKYMWPTLGYTTERNITPTQTSLAASVTYENQSSSQIRRVSGIAIEKIYDLT